MDKILENLVEFSCSLSFRDLPENVVHAARQRLFDSVGCAISAYDCDTAQIGRKLAGPPASPELAGRMLGSRKLFAADAAAFVNACMIRNLELNDAIVPGGHPSDCLGGLFALAPQAGASGEKLVTAMVVAYEILMRLQNAAQLRKHGYDQGFVLGVGTAAGLANLLGLNREATRHAISIATVGGLPMRASRSGQLSIWKGAATAYAVRNAVFSVQLAAGGMTGPESPFTGRHGLSDIIAESVELQPFGTTISDFLLPKTYTKYWPVSYGMQPLVWATIELRKQVVPEQLVSIDVQSSFTAWQEHGSEPEKWDPKTRATADHSLPYIMAWTLNHCSIDGKAYVPEAYLDPSIRPLMNIITMQVNDEIEKEYPEVMRIVVNAKDRSGKAYSVTSVNPPGHDKNPLSENDLVSKFTGLCEPRLGKARTAEVLKQWQNIHTAPNTKQAFDTINLDT